jgi:predicted dehydrogenase
MDARPRIALVGSGSMGSNHARVIAESDVAELALVVDLDVNRASALADRYGCRASDDFSAASACDAAVLATPTRLHPAQALALLGLGLPLLVEKPVAPDPDDTRAVVEESRRRELPLMCGFVERFNPAVTTVSELLTESPVHLLGIRHSPPTTQSTLSVVGDLLIHELDLALQYWQGAEVAEVHAGLSNAGTKVSQVADCVLRFDSGAVATLSASRAGQRKLRTQLIATDDALYDVDLLRQDVTVYRHRAHELTSGSTYRAETVIDIPFVRHRGEPLSLQLRHFVDLLNEQVDIDAERDSILPAHELAAQVESAS